MSAAGTRIEVPQELSTAFQRREREMQALGVDDTSLDSILAYLARLWSANDELNLISRKMTPEELVDNHVIDCLLALPRLREIVDLRAGNTGGVAEKASIADTKASASAIRAIADLGSGGGLPGVLYAILFPHIHFHLYEKSPKKQEFLNSCQAVAPNLNVHGEIPKSLGDIDLITARAFKPIDVILELSRDFYRTHVAKHASASTAVSHSTPTSTADPSTASAQPHYFLLKGRREKIDEELALARKKFKTLAARIETLRSPILEVERHIVLI